MLHFLFHCTFYSYFSFFTIYICSCVVTFLYFYICIILHCPLSGPDLIYISFLIIPCIIYYVTNKETLTLTLRLTRTPYNVLLHEAKSVAVEQVQDMFHLLCEHADGE